MSSVSEEQTGLVPGDAYSNEVTPTPTSEPGNVSETDDRINAETRALSNDTTAKTVRVIDPVQAWNDLTALNSTVDYFDFTELLCRIIVSDLWCFGKRKPVEVPVEGGEREGQEQEISDAAKTDADAGVEIEVIDNINDEFEENDLDLPMPYLLSLRLEKWLVTLPAL